MGKVLNSVIVDGRYDSRVSDRDLLEAFLLLATTCGSKPAKHSLNIVRKMKEDGQPIQGKEDDSAYAVNVEKVIYEGYVTAHNKTKHHFDPKLDSQAIRVSYVYWAKRRKLRLSYSHTIWKGKVLQGGIDLMQYVGVVQICPKKGSWPLLNKIIQKSGVREMIRKLQKGRAQSRSKARISQSSMAKPKYRQGSVSREVRKTAAKRR